MSATLDSILPALAGGVLIGGASLIASGATGKIPGISGLLARIMQAKPGDTAWRILFLAGLLAGAGLAFAISGSATTYRPLHSLTAMAVAGVLVGFGTRISGGCTSGHGVCGTGLGAKSSIVATVVFVVAGILTVRVLTILANITP